MSVLAVNKRATVNTSRKALIEFEVSGSAKRGPYDSLDEFTKI